MTAMVWLVLGVVALASSIVVVKVGGVVSFIWLVTDMLLTRARGRRPSEEDPPRTRDCCHLP